MKRQPERRKRNTKYLGLRSHITREKTVNTDLQSWNGFSKRGKGRETTHGVGMCSLFSQNISRAIEH